MKDTKNAEAVKKAEETQLNAEINASLKAIFTAVWQFFFNIGKVMALLFKALAKNIKERREVEARKKR